MEPQGLVAGVHIGFQKQWGNVVLGLEGAYTDTSADDRGPDSPAFAANFDSRTSIQRILSIGPRVGWAFDKALVYGTGGYAQASILTTDIVKATNTDNFKDTVKHHGWFLGAGVEFKLNSSWVLGVEYLHYDFGSERHFSPGGAIVFGGTRDIDVDADVVRARLTYMLGQ